MTRMTPLLERNEKFARTYTPTPLGVPAAQVFVITCLDHRVDPAIVHHTQCGTSLLADPGFRRRAAEATGLSEAALEASAVADPHVTVKTDVELLLASPLLSPKVSVSGHVYDIATGRVTTALDARYPEPNARR